MFNRLLDLMTTSQVEAAIINAGFKGDPKLNEMTEAAKRKMADWGRKPLLQGGEFTQNNVLLDRPGHRRLT